MEDDAAAARVGGQFDRDIRLAETIDDALGPSQIHPAGQVAMVLDEGVVRAIPEAHVSSRFDLRFIARPAQEVQQAPEGSALRGGWPSGRIGPQ